MTKAELIKELENYSDNMEVVYNDSEYGHIYIVKVILGDHDTAWRNENDGKKVIILDN